MAQTLGPPPLGRREAHKQATRQALQQAADRLFAEHGYGATTVRDIAEAAGVTERTFFRYFTGKEELIIEDAYGAQEVKLEAGDMVLYPASSLHLVNPVTRGARTASFFWVQSMVRDDGERALLFDLDQSIQQHARDNHLLIAGGGDNCVRLLPPLTLTLDEAREAIERFEAFCELAQAKAKAA